MYQSVQPALKIIDEIFDNLFLYYLQNPVCILTLTAHLSSDAKIASEILDLYLDFLKFTVEKGDPYTQVVPNILKNFPVTELSGFQCK